MRTLLILSVTSAAALGYARSRPPDTPANSTPSRCDTFARAAEMMRLGYANSHPLRDQDQIERAKAMLWAYPGGCTDATFHHIAWRLILSGEGDWAAPHVLRWGRAELSAADVPRNTFETYRSLFGLMSGRLLIARIDWRPADTPQLLREQFYEARVR